MYDELGIPNTRDESRIYGKSATAALYASVRVFLDEGKGVLLESAFNMELAELDIKNLVSGRDVSVSQVYCTASPEIRLKRYEDRIRNGDRHNGHPDGIGTRTKDDFAADEMKYGKLNIEQTVEVNTDSFTDDDYATLLDSVNIIVGGVLK